MAKSDEQTTDPVLADEAPVVEDPVPDPVDVQTADEEAQAAKETVDPNDDIQAAGIDVDREISVPPTVIDAEAPPEPTVKFAVNPEFKVPVLEEYVDDQGVNRGRVKEWSAPEGDIRISVSTYDPEVDTVVDEDGYVTLPAEVPQHIAVQIENHPAVVTE